LELEKNTIFYASMMADGNEVIPGAKPYEPIFGLSSFGTNRPYNQFFVHLDIGSLGKVMGAELPPPDTKRWTIRRKAAVLAAIRTGLITREEVYRRYQLSEEELFSWERAFEAHGLGGLRVTRLQMYRRRTAS
jgi:Protein of unknown function (DUF1153)